MNTMRYTKSKATELWKRICCDKADEHMQVNKVKCAEERRVKWTTYQNLDLWFDSWEKVLDDLGFFEVDAATREKFIPPHKLRDIANFDETCLSLDGSTITRGGRPEASWEDSRLPRVGKSMSKTSQTTTMIGGTNALGGALPPHFQFSLNAASEERMQIRTEAAIFFKQVLCKFGMKEEVSLCCTVGANEKGEMDKVEFTT